MGYQSVVQLLGISLIIRYGRSLYFSRGGIAWRSGKPGTDIAVILILYVIRQHHPDLIVQKSLGIGKPCQDCRRRLLRMKIKIGAGEIVGLGRITRRVTLDRT